MFEILEADIVVMQETKIQRKDLQDDMVLVPGWDVFFSLPKHKKGTAPTLICALQRLTILQDTLESLSTHVTQNARRYEQKKASPAS
jgi:exonuclease III